MDGSIKVSFPAVSLKASVFKSCFYSCLFCCLFQKLISIVALFCKFSKVRANDHLLLLFVDCRVSSFHFNNMVSNRQNV